MTIYYSLTFLMLAAEVALSFVIIAPLPHAVRKRLFGFLANNKIVSKIAYGVKISFIFIGILFLDALQRMFRVTAESDAARANGTAQPQGAAFGDGGLAARKFYAQRNTYLTGFTLFLSLLLTRTFYLVLELIHVQDEYAKVTSGQAKGGESAEVKKLKTDLETLRKQSLQQQKEHDRLADEYNKAVGRSAKKD
ncbi:B-cell receptor-associated 31-like protein [Schizophyllum commune Tattone D]|uniref:Endoplasmic reticulum transmembrane protein n=1 Tax=Schizophyllum commune (strain H4-8 / FGSC 9210) TaxID=578458 RepID=D8QG24_SCHCM|nr:B-cell receptor-associated 31-like protein [Schizophyllum commune H4-8]KAI5832993.1 B-cell receptor-associated 31-like protein [Schizophyllum commune Tattone D]KAI5887879.1 B-cell receptor-associated 31-like protein [Schizophyllum commune H4-8]